MDDEPGWTTCASRNRLGAPWVVLWDEIALGTFATKAEAKDFVNKHPTKQRVRIVRVIPPTEMPER